MVLPPSFSRKMGEIETVEAEKNGVDLFTPWHILPHFTLYLAVDFRCTHFFFNL